MIHGKLFQCDGEYSLTSDIKLLPVCCNTGCPTLSCTLGEALFAVASCNTSSRTIVIPDPVSTRRGINFPSTAPLTNNIELTEVASTPDRILGFVFPIGWRLAPTFQAMASDMPTASAFPADHVLAAGRLWILVLPVSSAL